MLLTKEFEVVLCGPNLKHYEDLGYEIPRIIDNQGRFVVKKGTRINVQIKDIQKSSNVKIIYSCDFCGEEFETSYKSYKKTHKNRGSTQFDICKSCSAKRAYDKSEKTRLLKSESFHSWCVNNKRFDLLDRWDYNLNEKSPEKVLHGSNKLFFFSCPLNIHESNAVVLSGITSGNNLEVACVACASFGFLYPDNVYLWSDKNKDDVYLVPAYSNKKFIWRCENEKHEEYSRTLANAVGFDFRCPKCVQERKESFLQEKVRNYFMFLGYSVLTERSGNLICINPKTGARLPYDNEIPDLNLIVETHGEQHYYETSWNNGNAKNTNKLEYVQWKDKYKKDYAISNGYYFLEIPYWERKDDKYKSTIDTMIAYILA